MENVEAVSQIFNYKSWDCVDDEINQYYRCTLNVPIGDHPIGSTVATIVVDSGKSVLSIYHTGIDGASCEKYRLNLTVGGRLNDND